jgi:hypothetical protein
MKRTNSTYIKYANLSYPINTHDGRYESYSDILNKGINQLITMLNKHCKVLVIRLDVHIPEHTKLNTNIGLFVDYLKRFIQRYYSTKNVGYIWVRETEKAKKQHYHLCIYVDGNKVRTSYKIVEWAERYLTSKGMTLYRPNNTFIMVLRNDKQTIDNAVYRMSYLAKVRGKGYVDKHVRNYSSSRIT